MKRKFEQSKIGEITVFYKTIKNDRVITKKAKHYIYIARDIYGYRIFGHKSPFVIKFTLDSHDIHLITLLVDRYKINNEYGMGVHDYCYPLYKMHKRCIIPIKIKDNSIDEQGILDTITTLNSKIKTKSHNNNTRRYVFKTKPAEEVLNSIKLALI